MEDVLRLMLMAVVLPAWLLAGLADWWCHRRMHIAHTAGSRESLLHLAMLAEVGAGLLLALFFEVNALVLAVLMVLLVLHQATAWADTRYAASRRPIPPVEQHVHSLLDCMPMVALGIVVVLHWGQFLALFGRGGEAARFTLTLRVPALPWWYVAGLLAAGLVLAVLPFAEEFRRCRRVEARRRSV